MLSGGDGAALACNSQWSLLDANILAVKSANGQSAENVSVICGTRLCCVDFEIQNDAVTPIRAYGSASPSLAEADYADGMMNVDMLTS
jgi:hypothetical protein